MIGWAVFEPFPPVRKTELSLGSEIIREHYRLLYRYYILVYIIIYNNILVLSN